MLDTTFADLPIDVHIVRRNWPKSDPKAKLYSITDEPDDYHMSYVDVPDGSFDCAILMTIDWKRERCTIMAIEKVADETAALKWYVEERHKRRAN